MEKYVIYTVIILLIAVLIGAFLIWPKYQDLNMRHQEIIIRQQELDSQEKYYQKLQQISLDLENYGESLAKIDSALPSDPLIPDLFNYLQKASSQSGLSLVSLSPAATAAFAAPSAGQPQEAGQTAPASKMKETTVSMGLSGTYSAFKNFLSVLEKSARFIEVGNFSFSNQSQPGGEEAKKPASEQVFSFSISIKVFSY